MERNKAENANLSLRLGSSKWVGPTLSTTQPPCKPLGQCPNLKRPTTTPPTHRPDYSVHANASTRQPTLIEWLSGREQQQRRHKVKLKVGLSAGHSFAFSPVFMPQPLIRGLWANMHRLGTLLALDCGTLGLMFQLGA